MNKYKYSCSFTWLLNAYSDDSVSILYIHPSLLLFDRVAQLGDRKFIDSYGDKQSILSKTYFI